MESSPKALVLSRRALRLAVAATAIYAGLLVSLLIATLVARDFVFTALGVPPEQQRDSLVLGMRLIMVVGLAGAGILFFILQRLFEIVDSVRVGEPFIVENAGRLRKIAWALLVVELSNYVVGAISAAVSTETLPLDLGWGISPTRWIAVLMLFVLAGVFEHGARMRADLEGTV